MAYDYKRLCNELLSYLYQCNWPDGKRFYALVERARAALDEPEPKMVTKAELDKFVEEYWGAMQGFYPGGHETIYTPFEFIAREHFVNFARDVLARWGNHPGSPNSSTPQPATDRVWPPSVAAGCHEAAASAVAGSPEQQLLAAAGNTIETLWQELHPTILAQPD